VASHLQSWSIAQALKKLQAIEDTMEDRELRKTYFEQITTSPEALAEFLASIPTLETPWDTVFQRTYCAACSAENCDAENCPHQAARHNPAWFLAQEVMEQDQQTDSGEFWCEAGIQDCRTCFVNGMCERQDLQERKSKEKVADDGNDPLR